MAKQPLNVELFYDDEWHALALADDPTVDEVLSVRKPIEIVSGRGDELGHASPTQTESALKNGAGIYNPRNPLSPLYGATGRNAPARLGLGVAHPGAAASSLVASTSHVAPSVTNPSASGILICGWSGPFPAGSYTAPGGMTESLDQSDSIQTMMVARDVVGAGATGTQTATSSASETWLAASVLVHGPSSITTGAIGGGTSLTVDGNAGDWWILVSSFAWNYTAAVPAAFPWDTDGGGWILLADTGTINSGDSDAAFNRMKVWAKQVKITDAAHTIAVESDTVDSTISWLTRIPAAEIDSVWSPRMHGEVSSWSPRRALHAHGATGSRGTPITEIEVSGITRRLTQGTPPVLPAVQRTVLGATNPIAPVGYWPMAAPSALTFRAPDMRLSDITGSASPDLSWSVDSSVPLLGGVFTSAARDIYVRPWGGLGSDDTMVSDYAMMARPTSNTSSFTLSNRSGDFFANVIASWVTGVPTLTLTTSAGTLDTAAADVAASVWNESSHAWRVYLTQSGADIFIRVYLDGVEIMSGTHVTATLSSGSFLPGLITAGRAECVVGPIIAWLGNPLAETIVHPSILGYPGEPAGERFTRLCAEAGIACAVAGDPSDTPEMGPQYPDSLINLLREVEKTDDGFVYDGRTFLGLAMRTGRSLYNQDPVLELDYELGHVAAPFDPIVDDLFVRNDVTASRREGAEAQAVKDTGPLNVNEPADDPEGAGRYVHRVDVNPFSDSVLPDVASWHLHRGTVDDTRWPNVTVDLDASPDIAAAASVVDPGDRITIANHPDSPDLISLIVIGAAETIESHHRKITFTCVPEKPFHIAEVEHENYKIIGSDTATLAEDLDTTETAIDIALGHCGPWVHEVDFDIIVGGERMTLTAVGAAAGTFPNQTQTFTVTRSVNGVVKSHTTGARVEMFHAAHYGQ